MVGGTVVDPLSIDPRAMNDSVGTAKLWLNLVGFILQVVFNVLSSFGVFFGNTNGSVSDKYKTLITPAGFAFAIWGVIYFFQACFVVWSLLPQQKANTLLIHGVSWYFAISCVLNATWVLVFAVGTDLAVQFCSFILFLVLASVLTIYVRCKCWLRQNNTWPEFLFIDVSFSLYAGWLTVASILNVSIAFIAGGATDSLWGVPAETWSIIMLSAALLINIIVVLTRRDFVFPLVLAWATYAIEAESKNYSVGLAAGIVAIAALVIGLLTAIYRIVKYCLQMKKQQEKNEKEANQPLNDAPGKEMLYS